MPHAHSTPDSSSAEFAHILCPVPAAPQTPAPWQVYGERIVEALREPGAWRRVVTEYLHSPDPVRRDAGRRLCAMMFEMRVTMTDIEVARVVLTPGARTDPDGGTPQAVSA